MPLPPWGDRVSCWGCGAGLTALPYLVTACPRGSEGAGRKGLIPLPHNNNSASKWGWEEGVKLAPWGCPTAL